MLNQESNITEALSTGNMIHGRKGEALTQSSKGIHQWNADNDTTCGELVLNFNVNARMKGEGLVIDTFKNDTYSSFCSDDLSTEKMSKCIDEAFYYLNEEISNKADLIRSVLLGLVGTGLFNGEEACTYNSQQRAFELFNS